MRWEVRWALPRGGMAHPTGRLGLGAGTLQPEQVHCLMVCLLGTLCKGRWGRYLVSQFMVLLWGLNLPQAPNLGHQIRAEQRAGRQGQPATQGGQARSHGSARGRLSPGGRECRLGPACAEPACRQRLLYTRVGELPRAASGAGLARCAPGLLPEGPKWVRVLLAEGEGVPAIETLLSGPFLRDKRGRGQGGLSTVPLSVFLVEPDSSPRRPGEELALWGRPQGWHSGTQAP